METTHKNLAKKTHELLMGMACTDSLTGLGNRRLFEQEYERLFSHAMRTGEKLHIILADVNKFKQFNQDFGRPVGDQALKIVARALEKVFRIGDVVTRWGGDDFAVLALDAKDRDAFEQNLLQDRINAAISSMGEDNTYTGRLTVTASIITWNGDDTKEELFKAVDRSVTSKKNHE